MMGMDQQVMERDAAAQRNIDMRELADLLAWCGNYIYKRESVTQSIYKAQQILVDWIHNTLSHNSVILITMHNFLF